MTYIRTIPPSDAEGVVREMYQETHARFGFVPNWAQAFSLRPGVRDGWIALLKSVQSNLPVRTYELATLAAARALRSTYCSLAHGSVLADKVFDPAAVTAIAKDAREAPLEPRERAMMAYAEKVALNADRITSADIDALRSHGYRDEEIFDVAAAGSGPLLLQQAPRCPGRGGRRDLQRHRSDAAGGVDGGKAGRRSARLTTGRA